MKEWKTIFHKNILSQGKDYYERGRVFDLKEKQGVYTATVIERKTYAVRIIARAPGRSRETYRFPFLYAQTGSAYPTNDWQYIYRMQRFRQAYQSDQRAATRLADRRIHETSL